MITIAKKTHGRVWKVGRRSFRYVYKGGKRIGKEVLTGVKGGVRKWAMHETYRRLSRGRK